jgi:hypothetical protein
VGDAPKLFIGLVTHPRSRFNADGRATTQITDLSEMLRGYGFMVQTLISNRNDFDESPQRIGFITRIKSAWLQVKTEKSWSKYLQAANGSKAVGRSPGRLFYLAMFVKRAISFLVSTQALKRLANIDLSHLRILREGINSQADWILVIEDDGVAGNISLVAENLSAVIPLFGIGKSGTLINLSQSICDAELGVGAIMANASEVHSFGGGGKVFQVSPAISNTVCANLYSLGFARKFASAIEGQKVLPSIPIDWRLNRLLMDAVATNIECYWVVPGMFVQGSMHENTEAG